MASVSGAPSTWILGIHSSQLARDPAKAGDPIDYLLSLAEAGLAEMRALIFELRPESLETEGLVAALQKQAAAAKARHGLTVTTDLCAEPDVPLDVKEAIYRVAQEATQNVAKHVKATTFHICLQASGGRLVLEVRNDGRGFDPTGDFPGHLGLRSMSERIASLKGDLEISSRPSQGTTVRATVPLT